MSAAKEREHRACAIRRLYSLKDHFGVPQLVVSTAATFLHRLYMLHSFASAPWQELSSIAFFLASKVEEQQRPLKYIVTVTLALNENPPRSPVEQPPNSHRYVYDETDPNFVDLRKRMLYWEEVMLRTLCFDLTVRQPNHAVLVVLGVCLKAERRAEADELKRVAWNFLGDSLYTNVSLLHRPNVLAAAALVCAAAQLYINLPTAPTPPAEKGTLEEAARELGEEMEVDEYWVEVLDVTREEVEDAVRVMLDAYDDASDPFVKAESGRERTAALALAAKLEPPRQPTPLPAPKQETATIKLEDVKPDIKPTLSIKDESSAGAEPIAEPGVVPQKRGLEEVEGQAETAKEEGEPPEAKVKVD